MRKLPFLPLGPRILVGLTVLVLLGMAAWWMAHGTFPRDAAPTATSAPATLAAEASPATPPAGPPWVYGRADARFTVVEFADLECPCCRAYFPVLKGWIEAHPEVNWQWQHLPLAMHDPAATTEARIAECAGEAGGQAAFWTAVAWLYAHTRGGGQGLPPDVTYPHLTPNMRRCLGGNRPDRIIRNQSARAVKLGIRGTPTLQLRDWQSGNTLVLPGPVEGDALLSAFDRLGSAQPDKGK